jgi:hypothetical protein
LIMTLRTAEWSMMTLLWWCQVRPQTGGVKRFPLPGGEREPSEHLRARRVRGSRPRRFCTVCSPSPARHSASKTRVNALMARDLSPPARGVRTCLRHTSSFPDRIRVRVWQARLSKFLSANGESKTSSLFPLARKKEAERRQACCLNLRTLRRGDGLSEARPPVGVPPRLLPEGVFVPMALLQAMLPGTRPERLIL